MTSVARLAQLAGGAIRYERTARGGCKLSRALSRLQLLVRSAILISKFISSWSHMFKVIFLQIIMASITASAATQKGETITAAGQQAGNTWGQAVRPAFDVASSKDESNKHIGKYIADAAKVSVASHGRFSLALSGGSQPEVGLRSAPAPIPRSTSPLCSK